jgi:hypothetical protein
MKMDEPSRTTLSHTRSKESNIFEYMDPIADPSVLHHGKHGKCSDVSVAPCGVDVIGYSMCVVHVLMLAVVVVIVLAAAVAILIVS